MQQNLILAAMKIAVMAAFAVFLMLDLFATQNLEEKVMKTREKVGGLAEGVAETNRKVDQALQAAQEAKSVSERTYERFDALLDAIERGGIRSGGGGPPKAGRDPVEAPREIRTGKPSVIAGIEVWPWSGEGWTVLADANTNKDPKRDIPEDKVDWDAVLPSSISGEPKGLNWYNDDRTVTVVTLAQYCAEQLAERKTTDPKEWNARLAERIEQSPDRKVFRIYLRRGVFWHRPALDLAKYRWLDKPFEVTTADIKYTIEMIQHPDSTSGQKSALDELEEVRVIDKYTVEFHWKRPNFYALPTSLELRPMPSHIWGRDEQGQPYDDDSRVAAFNSHWFSKNMCGNGPYRFVEYKLGHSLLFERSESFFGPRATFKEVYIPIVKDRQQALARFWNDEAASISLTGEQYRRIILEGKDAPTKIYKYENFEKRAPKQWKHTYFIWRRPVYGGFAWNMRRAVLKDARVRRALTHSLNRRAVVEKLFYGLGELIPVGQSVFSPYFPKHLKPLAFDLNKARALLDEAGWKDSDGDGIRDKLINGKRVDLAFDLVLASASSLQTTIGQMYKDDLLKVGARMNPLGVNSALWSQKNSERDFDGQIIFWFAGYDSDPRQLWASEYADQAGSNNYPGYKNPEADEIFDKLTTTFDYPTRIALYKRWYDMQFRDQPYTWIWSVHSPILVKTGYRIPEPKLTSPYVDRRLIFKWKD